MSTEEDVPFQPTDDLWEDTEAPFQPVPEWAKEEEETPVTPDPPAVPHTPEGPRCAIPMCGGVGAPLISLGGCTHHLHEVCLGRVLKANPNPMCPMCRNPYLSHMRRIIEANPYRTQPKAYSQPLPDDSYDPYGPPDSAPYRPRNATRYGERYDPTPQGRPVSYGTRFRTRQETTRPPTPPPGPSPIHPGTNKISMMGLEYLQLTR